MYIYYVHSFFIFWGFYKKMNDRQQDLLKEVRAIALLMIAATEQTEIDGVTISSLGTVLVEKIDTALDN